VALKVKKIGAVEVLSPAAWSVSQLSSFYAQNRTELVSHANRILKDRAKAEEIAQEALIKFMLAAPDLESERHALSYLHRTIENLCIDLFRAENRRPNLVALDDASAEVEANWQVPGDHSESIMAAEDAAIVRQALSLLSPAERAALIMWEMEGRSTKEIAKELGIKESSVRHTVSRARASLRKVLSTLIVDEKRGLTALDLLSTSYKKASDMAHKGGRVAMSLILLVSAFLGFNSMTGNEPIQTVISTHVSENSGAKAKLSNQEVVTESNVSEEVLATGPTISAKDAADELAFLNAQLESAAVMLETLQMIEGKQ
jgi:RNA polymerase sigma factor (sigma-70 family)